MAADMSAKTGIENFLQKNVLFYPFSLNTALDFIFMAFKNTV